VKLGLFGGSFDPIHQGHVLAARGALETVGLDRVLFLPTSDPPHKLPRQASPWARYVMVELALLRQEGLYASPHELTPGTTAYTVETLEHFRRQEPEAELHLLLGTDALAHLDTWKRWRELVTLARLVVLTRPGWELERIRRELRPELAEVLEPQADGLRGGQAAPLLVERMVDISSTEIRRQLARGEAPRAELLSPLVLDYISKYGWYR